LGLEHIRLWASLEALIVRDAQAGLRNTPAAK